MGGLLYILLFILITIADTVIHETKDDDIEKECPLALAYNNIIEEDLLPYIQDEASILHKVSSTNGKMNDNKYRTYWLDINNNNNNSKKETIEKRFFIEQIVHDLYKIAIESEKNNELCFDSQTIDDPRKDFTIMKNVIGAEWWVQDKEGGQDGNIGFHFDKDEGKATNERLMNTPFFSTITYLTDYGSPTVIFNQITAENGNKVIPKVPKEAIISYPKRARHVIFQGNLQHGVLGSLAHPLEEKQNRRITLLINWWTYIPAEPYVHFLLDHEVKKMKLYYPERAQKQIAKLRSSSSSFFSHLSSDLFKDKEDEEEKISSSSSLDLQRQEVEFFNINTDMEDTKSHKVEIPPGDLLFFEVNTTLNLNPGFYHVKWGENQIKGNIAILNLRNENQVRHLFHIPETKVLIFFNTWDKVDPHGLSETLFDEVLRISNKYINNNLKFYLAEYSICKDAMRQFEINQKNLPMAAIHQTHPSDYKLTMKTFLEEKNKKRFTAKGFEAFIKHYLKMKGKFSDKGEL